MSFPLRWFTPAPARRLALLRILIGGSALLYVIVRSPHLASFGDFDADRFDPVFIVGVLSDPLPSLAVKALVAVAIVAGLGFVAGWRYRITGPLFALLLLWVTTYRNSWGVVLHTENLMVLHAFILGFTSAADAFSLDSRRGIRRGPGDSSWVYGWPIRLLILVTVLTYLVSGWAKVRNGGWDWAVGDVLRNHIAHDNLRKLLLGDAYSPLGGWLVRYGWVFPPMALASLAVELGAPVALFGGRWAVSWVAGVMLFHVGILALMAILFPYQLLGIAFAPFFRVERGWDWLRSRWRKSSAPWSAVASG